MDSLFPKNPRFVRFFRTKRGFYRILWLMLLQFTVSNFKSFDEPRVFSMRAGGDKDHPDHVVKTGKWSAVKTAAIYGANAAGKSNLVLAMAFASDFILREAGANLKFRHHFHLANNNEKPSGFHWNFLCEGQLWSYGFELTKQHVSEEYLFVQDPNGGKERKWFERTTQNDKTEVKWGKAFMGSLPKDDAQLLRLSAKRIGGDELVLWRFVDNDIGAINPVYEWFETVLTVIPAESKFESLVPKAHNSSDFLDFLSEFLRFADVSIDCLMPKRVPFKLDTFLTSEASGELRQTWERGIADLKPDEGLLMLRDYVPMVIEKDHDGKIWRLELAARHKRDDGSDADFPLDWESSGTQRLIHLLAGLFQMKTQPTVLVIDEIERRFHPKLTRRFVELAGQCSIEGNQLIFTTHETALLDSLLLRRDEVFFARKKNNRTFLERLSDYPIRPDRDYEKAYELGRVGGGGPKLGFEMFGLMESEPNQDAYELEGVAELEGVEVATP